MSKEENNKGIVSRWFTDFWGKTCNPSIVDELAAPDMLLRCVIRGIENMKSTRR